MIELTRLNGSPLVVNSDFIKFAEASPDTMLTLINGEKIMVRESCAEVVERVIAYRARLWSESARLAPESMERLQRLIAAGTAAQAELGDRIQKQTGEPIEVDEEAAQRRRRRHT